VFSIERRRSRPEAAFKLSRHKKRTGREDRFRDEAALGGREDSRWRAYDGAGVSYVTYLSYTVRISSHFEVPRLSGLFGAALAQRRCCSREAGGSIGLGSHALRAHQNLSYET
jgi:hypothetical protein